MILTLSIYKFIIIAALFITLGVVNGIIFCWYRVNYKVLPGKHRSRETRPTFQYAYNKGWNDRLVLDYQRSLVPVVTAYPYDEPQDLDVRDEIEEGDLGELTDEQWAEFVKK